MKLGRRKIERIFQECLDAVQEGENLENVLARYPGQEKELSARLEMALWLKEQGKALTPRPGFIPASRQRLINRIRRESSSEVTRPRDPHVLKAFRRKRFWLVLNLASLAVLVLMVGFLGIQVFSYAETALPGDALYPVKLLAERARLQTASDPALKARLHVDFARLRSSEIVELIFEGRFTYLVDTSINLQYHVQQADRLLRTLKLTDPSLANALTEQLENTFSTQNLLLNLLIQAVPHEARGGVEKAMTAVAR